jgi:hypothetical protein
MMKGIGMGRETKRMEKNLTQNTELLIATYLLAIYVYEPSGMEVNLYGCHDTESVSRGDRHSTSQ